MPGVNVCNEPIYSKTYFSKFSMWYQLFETANLGSNCCTWGDLVTDWTSRLIIYITDSPTVGLTLGMEDGTKHHSLFSHVCAEPRFWRCDCREQGEEEEAVPWRTETTLRGWWRLWRNYPALGWMALVDCQKQSDQENSFWGNSQGWLRMSRLVCLDNY